MTIDDTSKCIFRVLDSLGNPIQFYESWTNDSADYCCILDENGALVLYQSPNYSKAWLNPFWSRRYGVELPIQNDFELGYEIVYTILEPDRFYLFTEDETSFLKEGNKLILLKANGDQSDYIMKRSFFGKWKIIKEIERLKKSVYSPE